MESLETEVKKVLRIVHVIETRVLSIRTCKGEDDFVHFEGSRESIAMPPGAYRPGDTVRITFNNITRNGRV